MVGKGFFKEAPKDSLFITSVFYTLQGEGPFSGRPAIFVRLTKCNLACSFCDTFFDKGDWLTYDEIDKKIEDCLFEFFGPECNLEYLKKDTVLVITGGEPLLQNNLTEFLRARIDDYFKIQIESNGIPSTEVPEGVFLVCSPKCAEDNGVATKYFKPSKTILERADCLKFVMSADQKSPYSRVPDWALDWAHETRKPIYVSPMNIYNDVPKESKLIRMDLQKSITLQERSTVDEKVSFWEPNLLNQELNRKNHEYVGKYCMQHGLIMNLQLHLFASLA